MLGKMLQNEMNDIQRVPALMYNNAFKSLEEVNLQNYEILPSEPLHDITEHIKNLFAELPTHLPKEEKKNYLTQQFTHHLMEKIANEDVIIELP